jgi:hypothetical protein
MYFYHKPVGEIATNGNLGVCCWQRQGAVGNVVNTTNPAMDDAVSETLIRVWS